MSQYAQRGVMRDWAMDLPLRHQGVLLAAVRGCDGMPKENSAKPLVRAIRYAFMNPADHREVGLPSAFMQDCFSEKELKGFLSDWDHYPVHFVQHLMHACQVIGYKHPDEEVRLCFGAAYYRIVKKFHLEPESHQKMDDRLCEDRIALYQSANSPE